VASKASNRVLNDARKAKKDEFYTQLPDIERELKHYQDQLKNKVVYCNCDDPRVSNFFHYFSYNFEKLELQKFHGQRKLEPQKTGQYKIHRTMVLSWTFEVYSKDLKDSALIGKHCFGKFSSFSDEEIDFLMNSKGNSLLFLQISNQHLLSRLGGGGGGGEDDIVVLQCFLVDPSEKGDLVLGGGAAGGGGGGSPSTCLPILGKNEILNNLKTSMIEQITITNRCPFSFVRMAIPVRSRFCHHLQSFDFMSALKIAYPDSLLPPISVSDYDHRLKTIKCPICGVEFCLGDLFRDGLTDYILEMDMDGLCKYDIDIESSTIKCSTEKFIERRSPEFIDLTLTVDEIVEEGFVFEEMESPLPLIKRDPVLDDEDFDSNISKKRRNGDSGDCVFDAIILE